MGNELSFHPRFVGDVRKAVAWYGDISDELANRFRTLVDQQLDAVERRPESFAIAFDDVRFTRIRRFPYIILFAMHHQKVHVLGLFHGASDPARWRDRAAEPNS